MRRIVFLFILFLSIWQVSIAQNIPERPEPPRLVNDFSNILSNNQVNQLENLLVSFANETSTQIVIVSINEFEGEISDFAFNLGETWGVGQEDKDNGIVIILKPKRGNDNGQVFVATGYGIEHLIPDAIANRDIVDNEMIPRFMENDYYGGLLNGISVIMDLTRGEYTAEAYHQSINTNQGASPFFLFFLIFFVIIPILRGRRHRYYSTGRSSLPFWIALGMLGSGRNMHSGSFSNFSSGSGSFGGFGGFGGGSFGGGGAGGSW